MTDSAERITDIETTVILTFQSAYRAPVSRFIRFDSAAEANEFVNQAHGRVVGGGRGAYQAQVLADVEVEKSDGVQLEIDRLFLVPEVAR